ncbi:MAG TPA: BT_3928 family protein [Flavisolibacter sp.]|jgi:uncharacterized membrane protein YphA (DoxX/SURF4 family)|nr:BT_3928 family protein [Flavisolibacter sp.]
MKIFVRLVQIFVGVLFIISGLVKANDPMGLSFKMQEFFELWSAGFRPGSFIANSLSAMHKSSLALSIAMITLEIVAGVALLIGWKKKFVLWLLLLLIIFFTFLTGYAYLSGKFTNCGCFGDCLPITPLTSFIKDIGLLLMILFLLIGRNYIAAVFSSKINAAALIASLLFSLGLQWYVLNYLPIADCLPFKKGNNIPDQMKAPPGSRPDSIAIKYIYEKGGKRFEWSANELPADFTTYKYIDRVDRVVRKGNAEPPIKGFTLVGVSGEDSTQAVLEQPFAVLIFSLEFTDERWLTYSRPLFDQAKSSHIPLYIVSGNLAEAKKEFEEAGIQGLQYFNTDFTVVRTVARTTPTILFLKRGTIVQKFSRNGALSAKAALASQ